MKVRNLDRMNVFVVLPYVCIYQNLVMWEGHIASSDSAGSTPSEDVGLSMILVCGNNAGSPK